MSGGSTVGVLVGEAEGVAVGVSVGLGVGVFVGLGVAVSVGDSVADGVGVGVDSGLQSFGISSSMWLSHFVMLRLSALSTSAGSSLTWLRA